MITMLENWGAAFIIIVLLIMLVLICSAILSLLKRISDRLIPSDEASAIILSASMVEQLKKEDEMLNSDEVNKISKRISKFNMHKVH